MRFGIASYHRPECPTLHTLLQLGIPRKEIVLAVNCEEDYEEYRQRYGEVLFKPKRNVAGNRNNLLEVLGTGAVVLDDDVKSFMRYERAHGKYGRYVEASGAELVQMLEETFARAQELGAECFGVAAQDNTMIAAQHYDRGHRYSVNGNFQGGFCGYVDGELRHNERYDVLDDYELNIRILAEGRKILRRNDWYANKGQMARNEGGCKELYEQGAQQRCMRQLQREWGPMFSVVGDAKGIRLRIAPEGVR